MSNLFFDISIYDYSGIDLSTFRSRFVVIMISTLMTQEQLFRFSATKIGYLNFRLRSMSFVFCENYMITIFLCRQHTSHALISDEFQKGFGFEFQIKITQHVSVEIESYHFSLLKSFRVYLVGLRLKRLYDLSRIEI